MASSTVSRRSMDKYRSVVNAYMTGGPGDLVVPDEVSAQYLRKLCEYRHVELTFFE